MKRLAILGSTGSIGTQTLEIVSKYPDRFEVEVLTANNNVDLLIEQAIRFQPDSVILVNEANYKKLQNALKAYPIKVFAGAAAVEQIVSSSTIDIVVTAMVGYSGLKPTIQAIKAGKSIALANKETLVVAGELISKLVQENGAKIIPVDSEHSAILQCLVGELNNPIEKITLTASGGPFRTLTSKELEVVSPEQALAHPNWNMGPKITIDSASMMNKGLEVIEAKWLFDLRPDQIEVIIHPQSIIHSFVHFSDGSVKAQLGLPDMRLPIVYALEYPDRITTDLPRFELKDYETLTFEQVDLKKFRNLALAFQAIEEGGIIPCAMNAANEIAVESFLKGRIGFLEMTNVIEEVLLGVKNSLNPGLEMLEDTDRRARESALRIIKKIN
ncbi:MAG: 1-deoxy-D-xylulose-5-phosphate reductoisomerase [Bacteroidales bacterium]|nr:1-deoxy-D-xylulose-5-phosphate reductoisomerase [Bacteroidales bacterium]